MVPSRRVELGLIGGLAAITAAALVLVELTPDGTDRYVWLGALALTALVVAGWRIGRWPARPGVVLAVSVAVVIVGYAAWFAWYTATRVPQTV